MIDVEHVYYLLQSIYYNEPAEADQVCVFGESCAPEKLIYHPNRKPILHIQSYQWIKM